MAFYNLHKFSFPGAMIILLMGIGFIYFLSVKAPKNLNKSEIVFIYDTARIKSVTDNPCAYDTFYAQRRGDTIKLEFRWWNNK